MNDFRCYVPIEEFKKSKGKDGESIYKFKGVASTDSEDSDGEFLDPDGFDLDQFKFVNFNHKQDPKYIIGEPTKAVVKNRNLMVEGNIWADTEVGSQVVDLMKALERNGSKSKLGISVEGKALERSPLNPKRVTKAKITAIALCPIPKNGDTWAELIQKGFTNDEADPEYEIMKSHEANGGNTELILDVINPDNGLRYTVDKNFKITIEKAISTDSSAKGTIKEDLDGDLKNLMNSSKEIKKSIMTLAKAKEQGKLSDEILEKINIKIKSL